MQDRLVVYDEQEHQKFSMSSGVPQGGVLSPLFFNITLDFILMNMDNEIKQLVDEGLILAFADDLVIMVNPNETEKIRKLISHLSKNGLETNQDK